MNISNKLREILDSPALESSPIAKALLALPKIKALYINKIGYLSISLDSPELLSYIPEERDVFFRTRSWVHFKQAINALNVHDIEKNNCEVFYKKSHVGVNFAYPTAFVAANSCNYSDIYLREEVLTYSGSGHLITQRRNQNRHKTYINYTKMHFFPQLRLGKAMKVKPGKLINKIFPNKFTNRDIEQFGNIFSAVSGDALSRRGLEFILVEGEKIPYYYNGDRYYQGGGTLNSSCMRSPQKSNRFRIYTQNNAKMLVLKRIGEQVIYGRAIVWPDVQFPNMDAPIYFMDRIYTVDYRDEEEFKKYARDRGWAYKPDQCADRKEHFRLPINDYQSSFRFTLNIPINVENIELFPYMDTFTYLNSDKDSLYNYSIDRAYCLTNYDTGEIYYDDDDDNEDSYIWSNYHNADILRDDAVFCGWIDDYILYNDSVEMYNGEFMPYDSDEICTPLHRNRKYYKDDCYYSNALSCYIYDEDQVKILFADGSRDYAHERDQVYSDFYSDYIYKPHAIVVEGIYIYEKDREAFNWWIKQPGDVVQQEIKDAELTHQHVTGLGGVAGPTFMSAAEYHNLIGVSTTTSALPYISTATYGTTWVSVNADGTIQSEFVPNPEDVSL